MTRDSPRNQEKEGNERKKKEKKGRRKIGKTMRERKEKKGREKDYQVRPKGGAANPDSDDGGKDRIRQ